MQESLLGSNERSSQQVREKVDELEKILADERQHHNEQIRVSKDREVELQASIAEYTKALAITQRSLDEKSCIIMITLLLVEIDTNVVELRRNAAQLKETLADSKTQKQELVDYKLKATKVLQSKEKTIQELTERLSAGPGNESTGANLAELLRVQQERDGLAQEKEELLMSLEQQRNASNGIPIDLQNTRRLVWPIYEFSCAERQGTVHCYLSRKYGIYPPHGGS